MGTQIILLERIENLGDMGEIVTVKPGFARNYLLPQRKALRATNQNKAFFEAQKKHLESENEKRKKEAQKFAAKLEGLKVPLIRQASEGGQLYGSVTARDIADEAASVSGEPIERSMVQLNRNFKTVGLFPVDITLHPEVKVSVTVNIARTPEEAEIQAKSGRALIAGAHQVEEPLEVSIEENLEEVLEEDALEAQKGKQAAADVKEKEEKEKAELRAAKKSAKKAEKEEKEPAAEDEDVSIG